MSEFASYVIDTSAIMHLDGHTSRRGARVYTTRERSSIWSGLIARIEDGRLKTVPQVLEELKRNNPDALEKLRPLRKQLVIPNPEFVSSVIALLREFPSLVRDDALSDPADPWIIAVAIRNAYVVVCNEVSSSIRKRPDGRIRIPDVCQRNRLECIDMDELISREGLA